jgi:DNA-directed RNA polymerase specialized sigma24 family protein
MLGSLSDADDAVQEAWLRFDRSPPADVRDLRGWLTTVVAKICLDMMRAGRRRQAASDPHLDEVALSAEDEAVLADSVGLALLVVLETRCSTRT